MGPPSSVQQQAAEQEWYFFSYKDRKYPSGTRTNRATAAGFWKATGRDKPVMSTRSPSAVIGMWKTLVYYRGRALNGCKTDWIIHEYRLVPDQHHHHHHQQEAAGGLAGVPRISEADDHDNPASASAAEAAVHLQLLSGHQLRLAASCSYSSSPKAASACQRLLRPI